MIWGDMSLTIEQMQEKHDEVTAQINELDEQITKLVNKREAHALVTYDIEAAMFKKKNPLKNLTWLSCIEGTYGQPLSIDITSKESYFIDDSDEKSHGNLNVEEALEYAGGSSFYCDLFESECIEGATVRMSVEAKPPHYGKKVYVTLFIDFDMQDEGWQDDVLQSNSIKVMKEFCEEWELSVDIPEPPIKKKGE